MPLARETPSKIFYSVTYREGSKREGKRSKKYTILIWIWIQRPEWMGRWRLPKFLQHGKWIEPDELFSIRPFFFLMSELESISPLGTEKNFYCIIQIFGASTRFFYFLLFFPNLFVTAHNIEDISLHFNLLTSIDSRHTYQHLQLSSFHLVNTYIYSFAPFLSNQSSKLTFSFHRGTITATW